MPAAMFTLQLCVSGCMCVCGSSALLLAPRLKQCQRVCDETSQTILFFFFHSGSPCLAVSRLSNSLFNLLFLSLVHYFFLIISPRLILTLCGHRYRSPLLFLSEYILPCYICSIPLPRSLVSDVVSQSIILHPASSC